MPPAILERFTQPAKQLRDTDWHVDKLYGFARAMGVHMLVATHSRYVIDLNRDPEGVSLYPGQFTTGLCPEVLFDKNPIYQPGMALQDAEIAQRRRQYWQPYHDRLRTLIDELKAAHERVVLLDAHSIASHVPLFFEGQLPDLNLGSADGASADRRLVASLEAICKESDYSAILNGRFKGGYITRHYGCPAEGVHAVQMELSQINYMQEAPPFAFDEAKADKLCRVLRPLVARLIDWSGSL